MRKYSKTSLYGIKVAARENLKMARFYRETGLNDYWYHVHMKFAHNQIITLLRYGKC